MIGSSALMRNPPHKSLPPAPDVRPDDSSTCERRAANLEMARVLKTQPLRMASDSQSGAIAYWKHEALHDIVEPMADHVIMAYPAGSQALERRTGKTAAIATARAGVVTIIPGRLDVTLGHPPALACRSALSSATDASAHRRRGQHGKP
ncbi:hypothetical protein ACVWW4_005500 [Bradyrhizobium sp. LB7.1]